SPSATASGRMSALTPTGASGRPRGRMLQLALAGIFLVAVVTALAIHFVPKGRTTSAAAPPAAPLQFLGASSRLLIPLDPAWSPNGAYVALVGYKLRCDSYSTIPQAAPPEADVTVYATANGALVGQFRPDQLVRQAVPLPTSVQAYLATLIPGTTPVFGIAF